jgi:hypothetical protein
MIVSEISLLGAVLIAFLVVVAMLALAFVDRKMLRRMLVIFGATVAQMVVVGAVVLLAFKTFAWWAYLLWYLLVLFLSICWVLYPIQFMWKKLLLPISAAVLAGSIVLGGSTILCLPINVFMTVYSVLMACMTASMIQTMVNFMRSMHQPDAHKQELSWRESVLPQVRSMAQPLVMVMPMLYAGMLVGGVSPYIGLMIILLLIAASFVANVLAGVIALTMIRKGARKQGA